MRRTTLSAILAALVVVVGIQPAVQAPVLAASACGGWSSTASPPPTIRVLRTATRSVDVVPFRTYVEKVMAAEWPAWYPPAALNAGAVAVKQYAWYYAMHRRSWYVTASGACYDVRDDTYDQVYSPARTVAGSQLSAVAATWSTTVRKYGSFFLTGYGAGTTGACGVETSSRRNRLAQRGTRGCALAGMDANAILHAYMDPGLSIVVAAVQPTSPPTSPSPSPAPLPSPSPSPAPAVTPSPPPSPLPTASPSSSPSQSSGPVPPVVSGAAGAASGASKPAPTATSTLVGEHSPSIAYRGRWGDAPYAGYSGGNAKWSRTAGSTATFTFTGSAVSWIGPRGPTRGRARILLDGREVARVDLYARSFQAQAVLFARSFARSGRHTLTIQVLSMPARPYVAIDGFLVKG